LELICNPVHFFVNFWHYNELAWLSQLLGIKFLKLFAKQNGFFMTMQQALNKLTYLIETDNTIRVTKT